MSNAYTPSSCRTSSSSPTDHTAGAALLGRPDSAWARVAISFALGLALLTGAQGVLALPEDADKPINIRADTVEYDQTGNRIIYRGSVQVDQGTLRVTAEIMTIDLQDGNKVKRITAEDTPARYRQQIEVGKEPVRAEALTIIYHTQDERVDLKGAANLEQEGSTLTGDLIVYDIVAGRVDATATEEAPVTMTLQPSAIRSTEADAEAETTPEPADDGQER
jgi:lipopolysaccharide export system protein LptA